MIFSNKIKALHNFLFCENCLNQIEPSDFCISNHFEMFNNNLIGLSNELENFLSLIYNFYKFDQDFTNEINKESLLCNKSLK